MNYFNDLDANPGFRGGLFDKPVPRGRPMGTNVRRRKGNSAMEIFGKHSADLLFCARRLH